MEVNSQHKQLVATTILNSPLKIAAISLSDILIWSTNYFCSSYLALSVIVVIRQHRRYIVQFLYHFTMKSITIDVLFSAICLFECRYYAMYFGFLPSDNMNFNIISTPISNDVNIMKVHANHFRYQRMYRWHSQLWSHLCWTWRRFWVLM